MHDWILVFDKIFAVNLLRRILIFIGIVLPVLLVAIYSYMHIRQNTTERIYQERRSIASLSQHVLREKLDRISDLGLSFSTRPVVCQDVNDKKWDAAIALMKKVPENFPFIDRVLIIDTLGTLMADVPPTPSAIGKNYSTLDWYRGYIRYHKAYLSEAYADTMSEHKVVTSYAAPIRNDSGKVCGILVLQMRVAKLLEWTKEVAAGSNGFLYIVDQKGNICISPEYPRTDSVISYAAVPAVKSALKGKNNAEILYNPIAKENRFVAYEQVPNYGWAVVVAQEADAAFATNSSVKFITIFYLTIILVTFGFAYFITREISWRKKAEAALQKSVDETRELYDLAPCGYLSGDSDIYICNINQTLLDWLGYKEDEVVGKMKYEDLLTPESRVKHLSTFDVVFAEYVKNGYVNDLEYDFQRKDGSFLHTLVNSAAVLDAKGNFVRSRSTVFDNTERKKIEEQMKLLNGELEAFSYSVSHDLRAPLRAISGFSQMLREDYGAKIDEEGRRLMNVIMNNTQKMGQLIDDLLDFSRLGRKELIKSKSSMTEQIENICEEVRLANPDRDIEFVIGAMPIVHIDPILMKQVWINLVSNAVKYSMLRDKAIINITADETDTEVIFCIRDNGAGFNMQYADKLFGVFQRLHSDRDFEGTGVGLAIVHRIILKHGGRIWAEGKVNEGATFYFSIPK